MKKGSKARHCHICGKTVFWVIPTGECVLGIRIMKVKNLPNFGGNDGKGYVCKDCKEKAERGAV